MAYDEGLAQRVREALCDTPDVGERKMFGGLCFTMGGHMIVGIVKESLMVRVGESDEARAMKRKGVRPMDFTGKPMKGYVFVNPSGTARDGDLEQWIEWAKAFVRTLPAKTGPH